MVKTATFDTADCLTDEETIAEYLTAALEDPNPDVFLAAVRDLARARGMAQLATDAGLGREAPFIARQNRPQCPSEQKTRLSGRETTAP